MKIFRSRMLFQKWRLKQKKSLGFVPTMGALHSGHASLVQRAARENDQVVVSIFVNPTQFGPKEDFKKYPRTEAADLKILKKMGVSAVYIPKNSNDIYPSENRFRIIPPKNLDSILEGKFRPGHFEGVSTVVLKLFGIVDADRAYFGEKDFQQLTVIKAMVSDLFLKTKIVACPTYRESSGLAMSSRNRYLADSDKMAAALLYRVLKTAKNLQSAKSALKSAGFKVDYLEAWNGRWLVAAKFAGVRLIDNIKRLK